jgi:hypothetical protein
LEGRATARLEALLEVHDQRAAADAAQQAARLSFDPSIEGERLRRYQLACNRSLLRTLDTLLAIRRTGDSPEPDPVGPEGIPSPGADEPALLNNGPSFEGEPIPVPLTQAWVAGVEPSATSGPPGNDSEAVAGPEPCPATPPDERNSLEEGETHSQRAGTEPCPPTTALSPARSGEDGPAILTRTSAPCGEPGPEPACSEPGADASPLGPVTSPEGEPPVASRRRAIRTSTRRREPRRDKPRSELPLARAVVERIRMLRPLIESALSLDSEPDESAPGAGLGTPEGSPPSAGKARNDSASHFAGGEPVAAAAQRNSQNEARARDPGRDLPIETAATAHDHESQTEQSCHLTVPP